MHEMSVNVQNMVKSTQTQASSVSETSASIDQMVASIQRVADTAKVLLDISNRSREEVHSGITTMEKAPMALIRSTTPFTPRVKSLMRWDSVLMTLEKSSRSSTISQNRPTYWR